MELALGSLFTVWKFHDFCITYILREIYFGCSMMVKSAILRYLEAHSHEFLHFLKAGIYQINNIQSP